MTRAADVLIVEHEALISMHLQVLTEELGHSTRLAATEEQAFAAIDARVPDLVILDTDRDKGKTAAIARLLRGLHVPIIACSASPRDRLPAEFAGLPLLNVPFIDEDVQKALRGAMGASDL